MFFLHLPKQSDARHGSFVTVAELFDRHAVGLSSGDFAAQKRIQLTHSFANIVRSIVGGGSIRAEIAWGATDITGHGNSFVVNAEKGVQHSLMQGVCREGRGKKEAPHVHA